MIKIARRFASPAAGYGRLGVTVAAIGTVLVLAVPASALAATPPKPPTITSAFTPSEIGVGDSTGSALGFTITNPNATSSLSGLAVTDTLPAGLTVDDPNGENGTCGSAGVITATPGSSTITLSGGSLKGAATCTISVSVISSVTGVLTNSTGLVKYTGGTSAAASTASLTVLPPPTLTASGLRNNAKIAYGKVVRVTYSCAQAGDATALGDCTAQDDLGDTILSGGALQTKKPGSHTLTITASSTDGLSTTDAINYTVLPDNRFSLSGLKHQSNGALGFRLSLPGAGRVKVVEVAHGKTFGSYTTNVHRKRKLAVTVRPTSAGSALLTAGSGAATVKLEVTYTPKHGVKRTVTKRGVKV